MVGGIGGRSEVLMAEASYLSLVMRVSRGVHDKLHGVAKGGEKPCGERMTDSSREDRFTQ